VRSIIYQFEDLPSFSRALAREDLELNLPATEKVADGEWVLAIFEMGTGRRATAAAARGVNRGGGTFVLAFERRDWERLRAFTEDHSSAHIKAAAPSDPSSEPLTEESGPLSKDPFGMEDPEPTLRSSLPMSQDRVLLVDDDAEIREVVSAMLDAVGLRVEAVETAERALERVHAQAFDLVILDWNLPGMSGIELCKVIRRDRDLVNVPVLFLTGNASQKDIVDAFASGADDYVTKPFRAPELGARIFGLLRRARAKQQPELSS
jgi:two-component system phosphate regulon response regulator PhoB